MQCPSAPFHHDLFALTQALPPLSVILAFRGSAKSTIMTLSLPIWSIVGVLQKKFVLISARTQEQARQFMRNIREELEHNDLLHGDLGPFRMEEDEWRNLVLVLPKYGAKIMAVSVEQSVRGLRHGPNRPDLFICDDIEDTQSVKTKEGRNAVYDFLKHDLLPAGSRATQTVIVGNMLHDDCVLMRLVREIDSGRLQGIYRAYPLLDESGACLWPGKYPRKEDVETEQKRIGNETVWVQEYLLRIVSSALRVVHPEWIHYYDELPGQEPLAAAVGIDLAFTDKSSSDYTAMVIGKAYRINGEFRIYVLPHPYHARVTPLEALEAAKTAARSNKVKGDEAILLVENINQQLFIQMLQQDDVYPEEVRPTADKRSRLALVTPLLQQGKVFFPRTGAEDLITELLGFGLERHDDLADAFAMLLTRLIEEDNDGYGGGLIRVELPRTYLGGRRWWYGL
jgi:predicted phage terminase large subunit-like protein